VPRSSARREWVLRKWILERGVWIIHNMFTHIEHFSLEHSFAPRRRLRNSLTSLPSSAVIKCADLYFGICWIDVSTFDSHTRRQ
jgi:hypothetical protein